MYTARIVVRCVICGETILSVEYAGVKARAEACEKCKAAVLEMRKRMEADHGKQEPHNDHAEIL